MKDYKVDLEEDGEEQDEGKQLYDKLVCFQNLRDLIYYLHYAYIECQEEGCSEKSDVYLNRLQKYVCKKCKSEKFKAEESTEAVFSRLRNQSEYLFKA